MDYANPEALVGTEWMAENLDVPGVHVIDATYFLPAAERGAARRRGRICRPPYPGRGFFRYRRHRGQFH